MGERKFRPEHHVWCHLFRLPVEGCPQCRTLWARYPYEPGEEERLVERYFPHALARRTTPDAVPHRTLYAV